MLTFSGQPGHWMGLNAAEGQGSLLVLHSVIDLLPLAAPVQSSVAVQAKSATVVVFLSPQLVVIAQKALASASVSAQ